MGKRVGIWFGDNVGGPDSATNVFYELRLRWQRLVQNDRIQRQADALIEEVGVLSDALKYGKEAEELRKECTMQVRKQVLKVRRLRGLPDEDPKLGLVETWVGDAEEGEEERGKWS